MVPYFVDMYRGDVATVGTPQTDGWGGKIMQLLPATTTHLLQEVFRAQPENLHVPVPVSNGKERRPDTVFGNLPHFQASDFDPSQLFRANFLRDRWGRLV